MSSATVRPGVSPRARRTTLIRVAAAAATLFVAIGAGFVWFAATLPEEPETLPTEKTDAVVVVTGSAGRLPAGLRLLQEKRAETLFISGVDRTAGLTELLRTVTPNGPPLDPLQCCISLGYEASDTIGNAAETAAWMREQGYRSLRLVTANYHMRRAALEFRIAMPDLRILTYAVDPAARESWWRSNATFSLLASEYAKYLVTGLRYAGAQVWRLLTGEAGTASKQ